MTPSADFLRLQLAFARRAALVHGAPLADTLPTHTGFVAAFGLGEEPTAHPLWPDLLGVLGAERTPERDAWLVSRLAPPRPRPEPAFGAFTFGLELDNRSRVRYHLWRRPGDRVLTAPEERRADLRALFAHLRAHEPQVDRVRGGSWLYHLPAYRALFPPAFLATAVPGDPADEYPMVALWGQFLRGDDGVHAPRADEFLGRLARADTPDDLAQAFPLKKLNLEGPIEPFLAFHGLE